MHILTLLTDFGATDHYVAAVKGVVLSRLEVPVQLVDVSHQLAPGDIQAGAFLVAALAPSFPAERTLHLAVVDPGVGSARRIVAARGPRGTFLAPDNGLLDGVLDLASEIRSVERSDLWVTGNGDTFHGRDRFAPIAAWLLAGGRFEDLGPAIDDPVRLAGGRSGQAEHGRWSARVVHVDHFGNLITDLPSTALPPGPLDAHLEGRSITARGSCYADLPEGVPGLIPGSSGTVEIALREASLARAWRVARGARLTIAAGGPAGGSVQSKPPTGVAMAPVPKERLMSTTWEYHIINVRSEGYRLDPNAVKELNRLGADGWELVSVTSVNFKTGATDNIAMVFKRPLEPG